MKLIIKINKKKIAFIYINNKKKYLIFINKKIYNIQKNIF